MREDWSGKAQGRFRGRRGVAVTVAVLFVAAFACTSDQRSPQTDTGGAATSSLDVFIEEDCAPNAIPWLEASAHVGESAAVVGRVVSWSHELPTEATSTFLYLGTQSPLVERLVIEIPPIARLRFADAPEEMLSGRLACVFGFIERAQGGSLIEIEQPEQITRVKEGSVQLGATEDEYASALRAVEGKGYEAIDPTEMYCFECTLHVIIGTCVEAVSSDCQHAFFFVGDRFVGNEPGPQKYLITVLRQEAAVITLGFSLSRPTDSRCCPTGGTVEVRFQWDGSELQVLDAMPSSDSVLDTNR